MYAKRFAVKEMYAKMFAMGGDISREVCCGGAVRKDVRRGGDVRFTVGELYAKRLAVGEIYVTEEKGGTSSLWEAEVLLKSSRMTRAMPSLLLGSLGQISRFTELMRGIPSLWGGR